MLAYVKASSQKIGGPNKIVEIDESKFGRRKYNRGHPIKGQWVFGGVERESGRTFFVPVPDRFAETLLAVICDWTVPGTTVISDCWGAYYDLEEHGYPHLTVNHSIGFVDPVSGAHTNTIESHWRHLKAALNPYNRRSGYIYIRWPTTCLPPGAGLRTSIPSTSFTSSLPPTGALLRLHPPPTSDAINSPYMHYKPQVHNPLPRCYYCSVYSTHTSVPPLASDNVLRRTPYCCVFWTRSKNTNLQVWFISSDIFLHASLFVTRFLYCG
jgi:hypothetical protein